MRILIVDDDPSLLKLLRLTLESLGHTVVPARDGTEALRLLEKEQVALVITDILMPNTDGYRFCFEARRTPGLENLPIILYSGTYTTSNDYDLGLRFGANAFVEKPASAQLLAVAIEKVVAGPAPLPTSDPTEDLGNLKQYSERLINKIEEKNLELQRKSDQLEISEEKFRQLAENIQEVFFMTDAAFSRVLYVSPAYELIWGRPAHSLCDNPRDWFASIHPADRDRVKALMSPSGSQLEPFSVEYRIIRPDDSVRSIHARAFPIRDASGEVYRFAGIAEDITERNGAQAQLIQAQKMEAVSRLAGDVARDFNASLTAIRGYCELALMKLDANAAARPDLQEVTKAAEQATRLTHQLLAFSRKQILQPRVLSLNEVVTDLQPLLAGLIDDRIEQVWDFASPLSSVRVDPGQLEQVIVHLAMNARDAMPNGGKLTIATANVKIDAAAARTNRGVPPGEYVKIAIQDTGTGMSADVLSHAFEPFFTTKGPGEGAGLGLPTADGIVRQSGGFITVESEPGAGTTVRVHLPRVDGASERSFATRAPATPRT